MKSDNLLKKRNRKYWKNLNLIFQKNQKILAKKMFLKKFKKKLEKKERKNLRL